MEEYKISVLCEGMVFGRVHWKGCQERTPRGFSWNDGKDSTTEIYLFTRKPRDIVKEHIERQLKGEGIKLLSLK